MAKKLFIVLVSFMFMVSSLVFTTRAWSWGERGHHLIAQNGALLIKSLAGKDAISKNLPQFFQERAIQMGHISNIPDTFWKDSIYQSAKVIVANSPTHYIDLEILIGAVDDKNMVAYAKKVKALPHLYTEILKKYQGKPNPLPGARKGAKETKAWNSQKEKKEGSLPLGSPKPINVYADVGTNPWRVDELYVALVEAFRCAKEKEEKSDLKRERKNWSLPFKSGPQSKPSGFYTCTKRQTRLQSLSAVVVLAGIMGHFIGDLANPYHTTVNFDGWETGNGGVHEYMEEEVVRFLPASLQADMMAKAYQKHFRSTLDFDLKVDWAQKAAAAGMALRLAGNSIRQLPKALRLDDQFAVIQKGSVVLSGDKSFLWEKNKYKKAIRRPAQNPKVIEGHKDFIVERLAVGSYALARIWYQAWLAGGRPKLKDVTGISIPYIFNVPFLWPTYDPVAI